ncbi:MAG: hypothetical protein HKO59_14285 [Phycisphaerales bacterium]|nr:hypothetical protein [Phycisphaerales bacterium]
MSLVGAFSLAGTAQAGAENVLIYEDLTLGVSAYQDAVAALGWSSFFTADAFTFANELNTGSYTHVISAHQNSFAAAGFEDALSNWAQSNPGSPVLISDWRVNGPQPYLAELGFNYTGATNLSNLVGTDDGPLAGLSSPVVSPGWGIFSYGVGGEGADIVATTSPGGGGQPIVAQNGSWFFNGFLSDTLAGADAIDIIIAELTVPAPGALALLGLAGLTARRRRRD